MSEESCEFDEQVKKYNRMLEEAYDYGDDYD